MVDDSNIEQDMPTCGHCGIPQNWRVTDLAEPVVKKCNGCGKKSSVWSYRIFVIRPMETQISGDKCNASSND